MWPKVLRDGHTDRLSMFTHNIAANTHFVHFLFI